MKQLRDLIGQREFHVVVFFVSLALFSWPLISVSDLENLGSIFVYLFGCWAVVIGLQFLISRCVRSPSPPETTNETEL
jgi:hypothetical protein